jgi:hypothetical protein
MKSNLCIGVFSFLFFFLFLTGNTHAQESNLDLKLFNEIVKCESNFNPRAYNPTDGGSPSYGLLQFKISTFRNFGIIYGVFPKGTTLQEAKKYIWRPEYQGAIAMGMMADGLYSHWFNCHNAALNN